VDALLASAAGWAKMKPGTSIRKARARIKKCFPFMYILSFCISHTIGLLKILGFPEQACLEFVSAPYGNL
jgi:hypothetical protein